MSTPKTEKQKKTENPLWNFLFNIIIPVGIIYSPTPDFLNPLHKFLFALAFPAGYFVYDLITRKKTNFISIIGFASIFLIGIIKVGGLPSEWVVFIKAAVPLIIALVFLMSLKTPTPLVRKLFYNEQILDVENIDHIIEEKQQKKLLSRIFTYSTYMLAASFIFSSALNFTLAKIIIKSPTGSEAFDQELGKMIIVSKFVIAIPCTIIMVLILWYIIRSLTRLTGLTFEELLAPQIREKSQNQNLQNLQD